MPGGPRFGSISTVRISLPFSILRTLRYPVGADEWDLIADWYHIGEPRRRGVDGAALYAELRERARRDGTNVWPPWDLPQSRSRRAADPQTDRWALMG